MESESITTVCCGGCKLEKGLCIRCFRTVKEIKDWRAYTEEKRMLVLGKIEKRKKHKISIGEFDQDCCKI